MKRFTLRSKKEVYALTSASGLNLKISEDHVLKHLNEEGVLSESALKNLKIGDTLALLPGDYQGTKEGAEDSVLFLGKNVPAKELYYWIGWSYGDGYIEQKRNKAVGLSITFGPNEQETAGDFFKFLVSLKLKPAYKNCDGRCTTVRVNSVKLVQELAALGALKEKSKNLGFPETALYNQPDKVFPFLSGYFDADGYASGSKKGYAFSSISKSFLEQTQQVLMAFGILSTLHIEHRSNLGWSALYTLTVTGTESQARFVDRMGLSYKVAASKFISKRDTRLTCYKPKDLGIKYNDFSYIGDNSQYISFSAYERLRAELGNLPEPLVQDTIASIEKLELASTVDLVLEYEHLFWCQGFYVHNSGRRGGVVPLQS